MPRQPRPWYRKFDDWWMVQLDGKQVKLARGKKSRQAAEHRFHELMLQRANNPAPENGEHTVASIIDAYLTHAKRDYAERTLYERQRYLQMFAESHGWRKVNDKDCLPFHLTSWLDAHQGWKSDWTLAQVVNIIQRPFNWAAKQRLISANPFRGVSHKPGASRRPLTDDEFRALLRVSSTWLNRKRSKNPSPSGRKRRKRPSAGARFRQLLIFLRYTGARPGEASALEWSDIDIDNAVIVLHEHKTSHTQRCKKPRIIPLHPVVLKLLIYLRQLGQPGNRVFLTHRKTPWNRSNLSLRVSRARRIAHIPDDAKLYGLRHGFGTRSILNGVDLKTLSELMGHSTTRMTEHYVHLAGQQKHLAAAMLQANGRRPGS
jgi:integrase